MSAYSPAEYAARYKIQAKNISIIAGGPTVIATANPNREVLSLSQVS